MASWIVGLFGGGAQQGMGAPSVGTRDPVAALKLAEATREREMAAIRRDPAFRREAERFEQAVSRVRSAGEALDDPRIRGFLLKAIGLPGLIDSPGLVKRALLSDPDDPKGLLARLNNQQLTAAARALRLDKGLDAIRLPEAVAKLREGWVRAEWFDRLRQRDPVSADAILFREQAGNYAGNIWGVLGDQVVRRVVTTAVGLPPELAIMSVEAQARTLSARFDPAKLSDPRFVERFAMRYAVVASSQPQTLAGGLLSGLRA
jgi:hypothetical protein